MPAISPPEARTETADVLRWRFTQLVQSGYRPADALALSRRADIDLHVAVQLLAAGCPSETAVRILL